jgi:hypothetical protein
MATKLRIHYVKRPIPERGSLDQKGYNAGVDEVAVDLRNISRAWNEEFYPLAISLPQGSRETRWDLNETIDPWLNGLDGSQIFVENHATVTSDNGWYWSSIDSRPLTIKEGFTALWTRLGEIYTELWTAINNISVTGGAGATSLDDLTDVTIVGPAAGEVLSWDGSQWINDTPAGGGDMLRAIYDTDTDGIVDRSERVDDGAGNNSTAAEVRTAVLNSHARQHNILNGADHSAAGLTIGHFMKATGATSFTFAAHGLTYTDVGAAPAIHHTQHEAGGIDIIKLDDLGTPDDNTDLDATITEHGLLPKLSGLGTECFLGDGTWGSIPGGAHDHDAGTY